MALPSLLSFQRGFVVSDGLMFSVCSSGDSTHLEPIRVIRHGIRGVLPEKSKESVSNPQRTESAKTAHNATGFEVRFAFRTLPADRLLFACSDPDFRRSVDAFIDRFFRPGVAEFDEVCLRYARNLLNGRWLWRNRILGSVSVVAKGKGDSGAEYRGDGSRLRDFENYTPDEERLAREVITTGLLSEAGEAPVVSVTGRIDFGFEGQVEVFASQNMVTKKPNGFARSLYKVDMISRKDLLRILLVADKSGEDAGEFAADQIDMGLAALRDQKIGNAIRVIDTWYSRYAQIGAPISVEPNGASLEYNEILRNRPEDGKTLLSRLDSFVPGEEFNKDAAYVIALMIRGGVFSEKG